MFNQSEWHETGSGRVGGESFYPRVHLRCENWDTNYKATPDYTLLDIDETDRPTFQPTQLSHVTTFNAAKEIFSRGRFTSRKWKQIGENVKEYFSWWSFEIDQLEIERERNKYQNTDILLHCFSSPAFQRGSRYGNFKFTYDISSLMDMYQGSVCAGQPPEVRVLGTFRYKQEVMHAVVVSCPGTSLFDDCPDIPSDPEAVISKSDQGWMWRPDSTGLDLPPFYRSWDHVGFAFHLPGGCSGFPVPPGVPPLTCCEIIKPNISRSDPIEEEEFDQCLEELREIWEANSPADNAEGATG
ncbi:uncharacterized protein [Mobula birostris]|uniref:uncharacterized protein n=1 Tax=Mobula birostris TaxID=1983395 RepID=UPI003B282F47